MGRSTSGARHVLVKRYQQYTAREGLGDLTAPSGVRPHAAEHPMMVMVGESTGNKYMRAVPHKGIGPDGDNSWLVKDMHQDLKSWGHPGGGQSILILKSDGEPAIVAVREALARFHGGRVTPEQPPPREHQINGLAEVTGRLARDQARDVKLQLQHNIEREVLEDEPIMPWLLRWAAMSMPRFKTGKDGNTPHRRQKGRKCDMEVVLFGEPSYIASQRSRATASGA
ncbi:hypothetical protein N9L68_00290 [bacterium]|nr:hypothetical protein [bacterium]